MNSENDRPQTVPAYSSIKDDHWRQQVVTDIKLNAKVIDKSDKIVYNQRHVDPLTNLRDVLRQLSNQEAFKYMRQCRLIVAKLKQSWVDVNEEIKSLMKTKEFLESAIEHIRKDILINQETIDNRVYRPARETVY
jgi:thiamine kinase-like enzyme